MGHILYDETAKGGFSGVVKYDQLNATKHWTTHFGNYMYLKFIMEHTTNTIEKRQANKEIGIASRKMAYWAKHPNFDVRVADQNKAKIVCDWSSKVSAKASSST